MQLKKYVNKHRFAPKLLALAMAALPLTAIDAKPLDGQSQDVMMQGFHWHSWQSEWWGIVGNLAGDVADAGIDMIWLPPATFAGSNGGAGYLPQEYFNYNSKYGSEAELRGAISALASNNVKIIGDIVINHRNGSTNWHDFKNPDWGTWAITSGDECFEPWNYSWDGPTPTTSCTDNMERGNADTGGSYAAARDVDHENVTVQNDIIDFLNGLKGLGFDGWRYDYVKGYAPWANRLYNNASDPYFSVGEHWTNMGDPNDHRNGLQWWINGTDRTSAAFDFTTKGLLNEILGWYKEENGGHTEFPGSWDFGRLKDFSGKPAGLIGIEPRYAVTFVDNHDTGPSESCDNGQRHWAVECDKVMMAYAYILTHPGIPTVYWPHYFDWGMKDDIKTLINIRKSNGIHSESSPNIREAKQGLYAATIEDKVAVKLGHLEWDPGSEYTLAASGQNWAVWTKSDIIIPEGCANSSMNLRGSFNSWANLAMTCNNDGVWEAQASFPAAGSFKFDVTGNWATNYGDDNGDNFVDAGGDNIPVASGGNYTVKFNDNTGSYEVIGGGVIIPPDDVNVTFTCTNGHTYWGQSVYAVGNIDELGNWDPASAVKLSAENYPTWTGVIQIPANTPVEWKCIKREENNPAQVQWQNGDNNSFNSGSGTNTNGGF
tara:strand:+ start:5347 stop:7317 length:1971 start_codon:yes stop_codon:yes gene_type:complete